MAKINKSDIHKLQVAVDKAGIKKELAKIPRTTVASRRTQLKDDLEQLKESRLEEIRYEMASYIDLILTPLGDEPVLSEESAFVLVRQAIATRLLKDLFEIVHTKIKDAAFLHFNASLDKEGYEDPENTNAQLEVPELGMKLAREGAGRQDATIDETKLKEGLGDLWEKVYNREIIPEREVWTLNVDALWNLVQNDPTLLRVVGDSLQPGDPKSARLNLRNMT
jgi:hypothetical protein